MILLILILLDNDIAENPGPFSDEISIFHVKPLGQMNRHLVGSIYGRSSMKIAHFVPIG
jgi:hypothetical protein